MRALAAAVRRDHGRLDALVSNAGIGTTVPGGGARQESRDGVECRYSFDELWHTDRTVPLCSPLPEPTAGDYLVAGRRTVDAMKWILALALATCLTGCGGSSAAVSSTAAATGADGQGGSASPASAVTSAGGSAAAAAPDAAVATSLCAFLKSEEPRLTGAGSAAGALATFAIDLANWVEQDPSHKLADSRALDTLTTATCPAVRSAVVKSLGGDSFAAVI